MRRASLLLARAAMAAVLLASTSCSIAQGSKSDDAGPFPVKIIDLQARGQQLLVITGACNDPPEQVMVYETKTEVRLVASSASQHSKGDCANGTWAFLRSVIGSRRVVDGSDDSTLLCGFDQCFSPRMTDNKPPRISPSRHRRAFIPRKQGSASIPWDAPIWHKENAYLDISYFPGCHNTVFVEVRENAALIRVRVIRDILRSPVPCGEEARERITLAQPLGDRPIIHEKVDGAQLPPSPRAGYFF